MGQIGSLILASTDPARLRDWYECAFRLQPDVDGFLRLGAVGLLMVSRDNVSDRNSEPDRLIINVHVEDASATVQHLNAMGVTWLAPLEYREPDGAWFATILDPDGNYIQIIELTDAYWSARQLRRRNAGLTAAALDREGL